MEDSPREGCALPEAPTFYPTAQEWASPGIYITQTVCRAPYLLGGTARIVPPASAAELWQEEESELVLSCRLESVGCLASKWTNGLDRLWADDYGGFCESRRLKVPRRPQVAGVDLDLFAVFSAVVEAGGWSIVDDMDRWPEIASRLQVCTICIAGRWVAWCPWADREGPTVPVRMFWVALLTLMPLYFAF